MKSMVRMMLAVLFVFVLSSCGAYLYDQPNIFGIRDYIWWHLSEHERSIVTSNLTSPTTSSVNRVGFVNCLNSCVPRDNSNSTGVYDVCFNKCLKKITPVPPLYHSSTPV